MALELAKEWTNSSIDDVSNMLGLAVTEGTPVLKDMAGSVIEKQIKQRVEWTYSDPEISDEDKYRVIATCSAPLEFRVLVVNWRATASAGFELLIDTLENKILRWKLMPESLDIVPSEETDTVQEIIGDGLEKAKERFQNFFKI